jgi:hypothetical protein
VLDRDFGSAALLRELVAVAGHVAILSAREACAALRERAARLTFRAGVLSVAAQTALFVVGAEGAVATNGSGSVAVPGWEATKAAGATAEARATEVHATKTVNQGSIATVAETRRGSHDRGRARLVVSAILLETARVVSKGGREASRGRDGRRGVGAKVSKRLGSAEVVAARAKLVRGVLVSSEVARPLVAKTAAVVEVVASGTHIAEVRGGSAVESTPLLVLQSGDLGHGRADAARGLLEDVNSTLVGLALGRVAQSHVVRKGVDDATLRW